jgi:hypothetical protein
VNCSAGIIASAMTGTLSTIETISRLRRPVSSGSASSSLSDVFGAGSAAV